MEKHPAEIELFLLTLHVSYSEFFRNPIDYSILGGYIFPSICLREREINNMVRIWSTACADGQEPYSIAIIIEDHLKKFHKDCRYSILATDISPKALSHAEAGVYGSHSVQNVNLAQLSAHFIQQGDSYVLHNNIKNRVEFGQYDMLDEHTTTPPSAVFCDFDMIVCCNLLIYYNTSIQQKILNNIHQALCPDGYLMVDESEKEMVKSFPGFHQFSHLGNIFVKT